MPHWHNGSVGCNRRTLHYVPDIDIGTKARDLGPSVRTPGKTIPKSDQVDFADVLRVNSRDKILEVAGHFSLGS